MKRVASLVVALIAGFGAVVVVPHAAHASTCTAATAEMETTARISGAGVLKFFTTVSCGGPTFLYAYNFVERDGVDGMNQYVGEDLQYCSPCTSVTATVTTVATAGLYRVVSYAIWDGVTPSEQVIRFLVAGGVVVPVPHQVSEVLTAVRI